MTPPTKPSASPANALGAATSPYLRQHADNPVDWREWGPAALERAVREERPIMLSVGYSACHWCHVMAHESFEDPATAELMNRAFINIKVDREERPDVDLIYQKVVALMGEGGGWPLTVFLTPDQRPFYGGTYFPKEPSYGRPSFTQVLTALDEAWRNDRTQIEEQAGQFMAGFSELARAVEERTSGPAEGLALDGPEVRAEAVTRLLTRFDDVWGGLGGAPKFPNVPALSLLLDHAAREPKAAEALQLTLEKMWQGGIFDHLRGGFARYAVDREWLVPHFEKMLYDNALLLGLYADASRKWPEASFMREAVTQTVAYLQTDMRSETGLFFSATDADSEGVEGKFYCWTPSQLREVLGDAQLAHEFGTAYGVSEEGNFEDGMSILHLRSERVQARVGLEAARNRLLEHRYGRVPPLRDDKMLTAWNALLVSGLCRSVLAARAWGAQGLADNYQRLAASTGEALIAQQSRPEGGVFRAQWEGRAHIIGFLEDVASLARACLDLHELDLGPSWLSSAESLASDLMHAFAREGGGFYFTSGDGEPLIERTESQYDSPLPSGLALAVEVLGRLDAIGRAPTGARAHLERTLSRFSRASAEPFAYAGLIRAAAYMRADARHVRLEGEGPSQLRALAQVVHEARARSDWPITLHAECGSGAARAIVCHAQTCRPAESDPKCLREILLDPEW